MAKKKGKERKKKKLKAQKERPKTPEAPEEPEKKEVKESSKPELPMAPLERIARKAGAERISAGAVEELRDAVEEIGLDIAKDIVKVSKHAGRRTIKPDDIRVVVE